MLMFRPNTSNVFFVAVFITVAATLCTRSADAFCSHHVGTCSETPRANGGVVNIESEWSQLMAYPGRVDDARNDHSREKSNKNGKTSNGTSGSNLGTNNGYCLHDRRSYLKYATGAAAWFTFSSASNAKSYSENAKNLERINSGDFSGGAVFNNNPTTDRGKKRRAITGCKTPLSREEAGRAILKRENMLSEKECNQMVLEGETEFMLQALRNLDCPTCPNGIGKTE